jgi:hypothetical protein
MLRLWRLLPFSLRGLRPAPPLRPALCAVRSARPWRHCTAAVLTPAPVLWAGLALFDLLLQHAPGGVRVDQPGGGEPRPFALF